MKMSGEEVIAAPRKVVWDALNDPEVLKKSITGCEELRKKNDKEFEAKVTAKVGPVKASFMGNVELSKLNPPRSYVISGEGKGGVAGFAKGGATVRLDAISADETKLVYDVDAQVGGKLAQIGSRLIDSTAKKMAADFFKKFNAIVSQRTKGDEDMAKSTKKAPAKKAAAKKTAAKKTAAKKTAAKKTAAKKTAAASARKPAAKKSAKKKAAAKSAASKPKAAVKSKAGAKARVEEAVTTAPVAKDAADIEAVSAADAKSQATRSYAQPETVGKTGGVPEEVSKATGSWTWIVLAAAAALVALWAFGGSD